MRLGQILKKWRMMSNFTISQVAEKIGIGASTLVHIEQGKVPDGKTLIKLMAWMFGEEKTEGVANGSPVPSNTQPNQ